MRLLPLHINELPAHPALESLLSTPPEQPQSAGTSPSQAAKVEASERPNLISFIEEVLDQATMFIDDTLLATFKEGPLKKSAPATAKVRILSRKISMAEIQAIPWINTSMYIPEVPFVPICAIAGLLSRREPYSLRILYRYSAKLVKSEQNRRSMVC